MHFDLRTSPLSTSKLSNQKPFSQKPSLLKPLSMVAVAVAAFGSMSNLQAETYFTDTSVSVLYGSDYDLVEDGELTTVTLEHVSAHDWGGVFFFVDRNQGANDIENNRFRETYGELSPTLKMATFNDSFIKQVNLAATYEFGSNSTGFDQDNYLVGIGADLNIPIPGTTYASATLYHAFNDNIDDDQQITLTYGWERNNFVVDGFIDYSFNNDDIEDNIHINPQIKYNLQEVLGIDNRLEVGMEYSYWKNKYGVDGVNQSAPSALVKFHF